MHRSLLLAALLGAFTFPAMAEPPLLVEVIEAQASPTVRERTLIGVVEAENSYPASFRTGGMITDILVDVGDHVATGSEIARLEDTTNRAQLDADQATLAAAQSRLRQAQQSRDRTEASLERGTATQADYDLAVENFLTAQSAHRQAETQLAKAQQALDDTVLRAVEDLIVTDRNVDAGEIVGAGTTVVELATDNQLNVVFYVPDFANLDQVVGLPITVEPIDGGARQTAVISEISPVVSLAGTVELKANLPHGADLSIGSLVEGRVDLEVAPSISLPATSLVASANGPSVWIIDPATSTVSLRQITISGYREGEIDISDGIHAGDLVVGSGSHVLYDGREIRMEAAQ